MFNTLVKNFKCYIALLLELFRVHINVADLAEAVDSFNLEVSVGHQFHYYTDGVVYKDLTNRNPREEMCKRV